LAIFFFIGRYSFLAGLNLAGRAGKFARERLRKLAAFSMPDGGGMPTAATGRAKGSAFHLRLKFLRWCQ